MTIQSELNAFGATQVMVFLKQTVAAAASASAAANPVTQVTKHFTHTTAGRFGALAAASGGGPTYRVYKNLGIVLGTVDPKSYQEIKNSDDVRAVAAVPQISLIRPTSVA